MMCHSVYDQVADSFEVKRDTLTLYYALSILLNLIRYDYSAKTHSYYLFGTCIAHFRTVIESSTEKV